MDFSKPDNARKINKLKVLSAIKSLESPTRAELSRYLLLNKVSISEIVDALIKEGLVKESSKIFYSSGRPGTLLEINRASGIVLSMTLDKTGCYLAASDTLGKTIRLERFSRGLERKTLSENFQQSLKRIIKNDSEKIYGMVAATDEDLSFFFSQISIPSISVSPITARCINEREKMKNEEDRLLFVDLDDEPSALYGGSSFMKLDPLFEGFESIKSISRRKSTTSSSLFSQEDEENVDYILSVADKIASACMVLNIDAVILMGSLSLLCQNMLLTLKNRVNSLTGGMEIRCTCSQRGEIEGSAIIALDTFFYKKRMLDLIKKAEKF